MIFFIFSDPLSSLVLFPSFFLNRRYFFSARKNPHRREEGPWTLSNSPLFSSFKDLSPRHSNFSTIRTLFYKIRRNRKLISRRRPAIQRSVSIPFTRQFFPRHRSMQCGLKSFSELFSPLWLFVESFQLSLQNLFCLYYFLELFYHGPVGIFFVSWRMAESEVIYLEDIVNVERDVTYIGDARSAVAAPTVKRERIQPPRPPTPRAELATDLSRLVRPFCLLQDHVVRHHYPLIDWLIDLYGVFSIDRLIDWLIDSLSVACLIGMSRLILIVFLGGDFFRVAGFCTRHFSTQRGFRHRTLQSGGESRPRCRRWLCGDQTGHRISRNFPQNLEPQWKADQVFSFRSSAIRKSASRGSSRNASRTKQW